MTASPPRRFRAAVRAAASVAALLGAVACQTPAAVPVGSVLESEVHFSPVVPDVADHTAAELAAAALASVPVAPRDEEASRALARLEAIDRVLAAAEEPRTGLVPVSIDLVNATRGDDDGYREATRDLLERGDLDPALEARLKQAVRDDPLTLADARIRDARVLSFARAFNAVAEPVGQSLLSTAMAPYRIARSLVNYAIAVYTEEALPLQRRQALTHWRNFLRRHPEASEAPNLLPRVEAAEARWRRTQRDRAVRVAERALDHGQPRLALVYANRALGHQPEDRRASELRDQAVRELGDQRRNWSRSLAAAPPGAAVAPEEGRRLALALLAPGGDVAGEARALLGGDEGDPLADEARFALATALGEAGEESAMWKALDELSEGDAAESNMARHAAALTTNPNENRYAAFTEARRHHRLRRALWVLLGPWCRGPPDRGLPPGVEWLLGAPSVAQSLLATPVRLIQLPWMGDLPSERVTALYAGRYLERRPNGEHSGEVRRWLQSYEADRENWLGALRVADGESDSNPEELSELREKAAEQSLAIARREKRRDLRNTMYRRVAREFPQTASGREAGRLARTEIQNATPQRIAISRGFLRENPRVAGPDGLGLAPGLLDGDPANGELHPEGAALIGGSTVELSFVEGGDDDPPARVLRTLSAEHLARLVSTLEETSFRNSLIDSDDALGADAQRDVFFERARLGLADQIDERATAESTYQYRGLRERYGMVRSRESILPFELVLQGSFTDLSLGAFPRIRKPRETPDAFLYR